MKKKEFIMGISILATVILVAGSIQASTLQTKKSTESSLQTTTISYEFSHPLIQQNDVYTSILIMEATGYQNIPGEPIIPIVMRTLEIPFGASIKEMKCVLTTDQERGLPQKITPAARP